MKETPAKLAAALRDEADHLIADASERQRSLEPFAGVLHVDVRSASGAARAEELANVLRSTAATLEDA